MASDLVEKVAMEMYDFWGPHPDGCEWDGMRIAETTKNNMRGTARAAIKAVAEYLQSRPHDVNLVYWLGGVLLLDELKEPPHE
jgi:hypothetical protein